MPEVRIDGEYFQVTEIEKNGKPTCVFYVDSGSSRIGIVRRDFQQTIEEVQAHLDAGSEEPFARHGLMTKPIRLATTKSQLQLDAPSEIEPIYRNGMLVGEQFTLSKDTLETVATKTKFDSFCELVFIPSN